MIWIKSILLDSVTLQKKLNSNGLYFTKWSGAHTGKRLTIPRMLCGQEDDNFPIQGFTQTQFPVQVRFEIRQKKVHGERFGKNMN